MLLMVPHYFNHVLLHHESSRFSTISSSTHHPFTYPFHPFILHASIYHPCIHASIHTPCIHLPSTQPCIHSSSRHPSTIHASMHPFILHASIYHPCNHASIHPPGIHLPSMHPCILKHMGHFQFRLHGVLNQNFYFVASLEFPDLPRRLPWWSKTNHLPSLQVGVSSAEFPASPGRWNSFEF